jgi:aspartate aminotransferase
MASNYERILELKKAVVRRFAEDYSLDYRPEGVLISCGAKHSLYNIMQALIDDGDEVIIFAPYWVSYREIIKMAEGKAVYINALIDNDFKITAEQIEERITDKTKLFIFSSPCNPTGSVYTKEELKKIADVFAKHKNIYIISDEIYEHINFNGKHQSIAQFKNIYDRVITVNGVSKAFAMTGWRLGYIGASKEIVNACNKLQGQFTSGASSISQRAAIKAVSIDPSESTELKSMVEAFRERRDLALKLLGEIPGIKTNIPLGAFYIFPNITHYFGKSNGDVTVNNSSDLCFYLLNKVYVALVPGDAFGNPNCIRFSYATSNKKIIEAIGRIKQALSELK